MPALPATPLPLIQSWADHDHAWRAAGPGVEATSDGGRHWRVVFRVGPGGAVSVNSLLRTSATAGAIGIDAAGAFATNDAGRHWVQLAADAPELGRGDEAYATENNRLLRVAWPPRNLRCGHSGRWFHSLAPPFELQGPRPRNICLGADGVTIPTRVVYTLAQPPDTFLVLKLRRLIPGGGVVADVIDETNEREWRATGTLVYRNGVGTVSPR